MTDPKEGDPKHYYTQPSISIERYGLDPGIGGAYEGSGHTIKNVFYEIPDMPLQAIGLFKSGTVKNITYEVPDNIVVNLTNDLFEEEIGSTKIWDGANPNGMHDGIKVGMLAGSSFVPENCKVIAKRLTVTSSKADIYVGVLFGVTNGHITIGPDSGGHHARADSLTVQGTGGDTSVVAGGLAGMFLQRVQNSTSTITSMTVTGTGKVVCAGGLAGRSISNNAGPSRILRNCAAEVGTLSVTGPGTFDKNLICGGGLIGWGDIIENCSAVVTESLTVTATGGEAYAGGLAGGGSDVQNCSAVAATVKAEGQNGYAGGLLGAEKMGYHSRNDKYAPLPDLNVKNSYAAVAVLQGTTETTTDAFCGKWENFTNWDEVKQSPSKNAIIWTARRTAGTSAAQTIRWSPQRSPATESPECPTTR